MHHLLAGAASALTNSIATLVMPSIGVNVQRTMPPVVMVRIEALAVDVLRRLLVEPDDVAFRALERLAPLVVGAKLEGRPASRDVLDADQVECLRDAGAVDGLAEAVLGDQAGAELAAGRAAQLALDDVAGGSGRVA